MDLSKGTKCLERNDDILTEILLRLPSKSIFIFTCVTTRWSNVINDRCFRILYRERTRRSLTCSNPHGRLLGFVQNDNKFGTYIRRPFANPVHSFIPVHGEEYVHGAARSGDLFPVERGYFITCTKDGLFLCGRIPHIYHVGNPITGRWETLPSPPMPQGFSRNNISVGLSSNEEDDALGGKIINFRVIVATGCEYLFGSIDSHIPGSNVIPIETYSSRTREWRRTSLISEIPVKIRNGKAPTFSGGFFHWFTTDDENIVSYDPSSLDKEDDEHFNKGSVMENKKKHVVHVTEIPCILGYKIIWRSDNGQTIWLGNSSFVNGVEVLRKCHDADDWACISTVEPDTMKNDIIRITQKDIQNEVALGYWEKSPRENLHRDIVWMIAFMPWDPKLIVIRYWERIFIYDCIRKKSDEVMLDGNPHVTDLAWEWYPFFHSLSSSPYNLKDGEKP